MSRYVWLTNTPYTDCQQVVEEMTNEEINQQLVVLVPHGTEMFTTEQLIAMGLVGIYRVEKE